MRYIVTSESPIWVKEKADQNSRNVDILYPQTTIDVTNIDGAWFQYASGWFNAYDSNGNMLVSKTELSPLLKTAMYSLNMSTAETPLESNNMATMLSASAVETTATDTSSTTASGTGTSSSKTEEPKKDDKPKDPHRNDDGTLKEETYTDASGTKVTVMKTDSGGYYIARVSGEGKQTDQYYYDSKEKLISVKYTSEEADGWHNTTEQDAAGNKIETKYTTDANTGKITKTIIAYSPDGKEVGKETHDMDKEGKDNSYNEDMASALGAKDSTFNVDASAASANPGSSIADLRVVDTFGIHGMPYQYMDEVDRPLATGTGCFGRMYADRIVAKMPLLILTPGEPEFLSGWSSKEKESFLEGIMTTMSSQSDLSNIVRREGRYYSFKNRWDLYMKYVAPLEMAGAHFLGLQDEVMPWSGGMSLGSYDWSNFYNKTIHSKLNYRNSVPFYIHADTQISDTMGNGTTKSSLADKVNQFSDKAKEIRFLMGTMGSQAGSKWMAAKGAGGSDNTMKNQENAQRLAADILGKNNFIDSISANLNTIMEGGKLIFPEIYSDSSFGRSYSVTMKFRTPDPDALSWYLNIFSPICHLLPFVMPKQSGPNGYLSPFLCRGFYKGLWNCNLGLVTDMTVTRGEMGNWTLSGLPCSVDVTLTIKDLYDIIGASSMDDSKYGIMNNIGLLDYIANMCGVNINEADITRMIKMYYAFKVSGRFNSFVDLNVEAALDQWGSNVLLNAYKGRI